MEYYDGINNGDFYLCDRCNVAKLNDYEYENNVRGCLLYTSPSPRDGLLSRMPSSA